MTAVAARDELEWHRVLATDELPEGRVTTVHAGLKSVALVGERIVVFARLAKSEAVP